MLIEFTVGNFRSIKEKITLSMVADRRVSKDKALDAQNTIAIDDHLRLLTSAAIYGANASGKSNLMLAARFMKNLVLNSSSSTRSEDKIATEPFRLSTESETASSFFEITFLLEGKKYRYGFEVTAERVVAEWLFVARTSRESGLFERDQDDIKVLTPNFKEGKGLEERTRSNALFLSVVAQFNGDIATKIQGWFRQFHVNLGLNDELDLRWATSRFHSSDDRDAITNLMKDLDLGIDELQSEAVALAWVSMPPEQAALFRQVFSQLSPNRPVAEERPEIRTMHRKYDAKGTIIGSEVFRLEFDESAGTRRLFGLAAPIVNALSRGRVVFVDELDARLHPLLTCSIIGLFNNKQTNPHNAQLIFTTHDTNLLRNDVFRRDQVWFVEKDKFGASHLYSLAEFKVRNDASYKENYIQGRYGAIPFVRTPQLALVGSDDAEE